MRLLPISVLVVLLMMQPVSACTMVHPEGMIITNIDLLEDYSNTISIELEHTDQDITAILYYDFINDQFSQSMNELNPVEYRPDKLVFNITDYELTTEFNAGDEAVNVTLSRYNTTILHDDIALGKDEPQETPLYFVSESLDIMYLQMNGGYLYNISSAELLAKIEPIGPLFTISLTRTPIQIPINEDYHIFTASNTAACYADIYYSYNTQGYERIEVRLIDQPEIYDARSDIIFTYSNSYNYDTSVNTYVIEMIHLDQLMTEFVEFDDTEIKRSDTGTPNINSEEPAIDATASYVHIFTMISTMLISITLIRRDRHN